jgi:hypothetical protein
MRKMLYSESRYVYLGFALRSALLDIFSLVFELRARLCGLKSVALG